MTPFNSYILNEMHARRSTEEKKAQSTKLMKLTAHASIQNKLSLMLSKDDERL